MNYNVYEKDGKVIIVPIKNLIIVYIKNQGINLVMLVMKY